MIIFMFSFLFLSFTICPLFPLVFLSLSLYIYTFFLFQCFVLLQCFVSLYLSFSLSLSPPLPLSRSTYHFLCLSFSLSVLSLTHTFSSCIIPLFFLSLYSPHQSIQSIDSVECGNQGLCDRATGRSEEHTLNSSHRR